ncbi:MAG: carboxypeptidase-like regulatory domain-containing protein, partial [Prevotella sp.]|nr:carboxypeptidase-like regulatory domain-containing protein [Prevotella sp.]
MKKRLTMFLACMFLCLGAALAQNKITGTVFEDNGEPCIGATVMIQGTKQGTKTDLDGHFTISVPA